MKNYFEDGALAFLDMLESTAKSSIKVADDKLSPGAPENAFTDKEALEYARAVVGSSFKALNPQSEYDYEKLLELISSAFIIGSRGTISVTVRQAIAREPKPARIPAGILQNAIKEVSASKGIQIKVGLKYMELHFQKDVARKLGIDPINPKHLSGSTLRNAAAKIKREQN